MIHAYADASMDSPICAVGYVLFRSDGTEQQFLDAGTRLFNKQEDDRRIDWGSNRLEYYAAIIAVRAALEYTNEPIILSLDHQDVVGHIRDGTDPFEPYFRHALMSFLPRFEDYFVQVVHRDHNEIAHEQARIGLKIGRDIQQGVV